MANLTLNLYRITKAGWNNFWRNKWLSVATVSVMVLAIFFVTSLILVNFIGQAILVNLQNKIDVSVYLKQDSLERDINKVRSDLLFLPEVKNVTYVSAEQALVSFREKHKDNPVLMESVEELGNPLLPALNIEAQSASQYDGIISFLESDKYAQMIEKINYQEAKPLIERLSRFSDKVSRAGIIISIILAIVAGLVAFNTIRLAMYNFRDEVAVMRLVGASNWYIRGPFLVEGLLYGVIAAVATAMVLFPVLYLLSPKIDLIVSNTNIFGWFQQNFVKLFFLQLLAGLLLGGVSSAVAIRKYLRV